MRAFFFYVRYALPYLLAIISLIGAALGGAGTLLGALVLFGLHPVVDSLFRDPPEIPENTPTRSRYADALIVAALPFMCVFLFAGVIHAMSATPMELVGLILSFGSISGTLGINIAHELVHRREQSLRGLGVGLLTLSNFSHYAVEHVYGHHKNVATPLDPASARRNEWIYTYHLRSYFGGLKDALLIEFRKGSRSFWGPLKNKVLWFLILQTLLTASVYGLYGLQALYFWLGQSVVGILLLQSADYIEHYGLSRRKNESGLYEGVKAQHSWDCYQKWTNYSLLNLGFHSHHHLKAALPFTELKQEPLAPRLPYGYSAMVLMAFVPPLFFKVVNPRLPQNPK